jgi:hypothetical protein
MVTVKFQMDVEETEIPHAMTLLRDIVRRFEFPKNEIKVEHSPLPVCPDCLEADCDAFNNPNRDTDIEELPPVDVDPADYAYLAGLCNQLCEAADLEDEDGLPPMCGDLVEINGNEYVVVAQHISGHIELEPRGEFDNEESPTLH